MYIVVIFLYFCVIMFDFKPHYKQNSKKLNVLYIIISIIGFGLLILYSLNIFLTDLIG